MRTTLTLDDDVVTAIDKELRHRPGSSYKEVVNDLLRAGIHSRHLVRKAPKFKVRARSLGLRQGLNYDDIGSLLEAIESAEHK